MDCNSLLNTFKLTLGHSHYNDRAIFESVGLHLDEAYHILSKANEGLKVSGLEDIRISDFFLAMNFMKEYRFEMIAALQFDILSTSTYENHLWTTLQRLDRVLPQVQFFTHMKSLFFNFT
jgi:hypothetical protein